MKRGLLFVMLSVLLGELCARQTLVDARGRDERDRLFAPGRRFSGRRAGRRQRPCGCAGSSRTGITCTARRSASWRKARTSSWARHIAPGTVKRDPYLGTKEVYTQQVEGTVPYQRFDYGAHPLQVKVTYQGCAEAGLCYPLITKVLFPVAGGAGRPGRAVGPSLGSRRDRRRSSPFCWPAAPAQGAQARTPGMTDRTLRAARGCARDRRRHLGGNSHLLELGVPGARHRGVPTPVGEVSPPISSDLVDQPHAGLAGSDVKIPTRLPEFTLADLGGMPTPIARWKGKSLVINFWATWCAPCRREIPLLGALAAEWADRGVVVVGVAVDHRASRRRICAGAEDRYPLLVGEQDALDAALALGVVSPVFPFTVFTDERGEVVALYVGELHPAAGRSHPVAGAKHRSA